MLKEKNCISMRNMMCHLYEMNQQPLWKQPNGIMLHDIIYNNNNINKNINKNIKRIKVIKKNLFIKFILQAFKQLRNRHNDCKRNSSILFVFL